MPPNSPQPPRTRLYLSFLHRYSVDTLGCDALRRCTPEVQEAVIERGLEGARNPSSALLARIKDMNQRQRDGQEKQVFLMGVCLRKKDEKGIFDASLPFLFFVLLGSCL